MKYHDSLILKRNVDSHGNPVSINILDVKQVMDSHSCIVLTQLPDEYYGVNIQGYNEVYDVDKLGALDYKVDYANGIVYFNPVNIGKSFSIDYKGTGCELIYSSRVATKLDRYGNAIETLEDIVDKVHEIKLTLDRISKSEELIDQIHSDLDKTEIIMPQLNELVTESERVKEELDEVINAAQDDINTIKAAGNTEVLINVDEWVLNGTIYEKEITHDLNSENATKYENIQLARSCTTYYRPKDNLTVGTSVFDTTLGKPIWCKSVTEYESDGVTVKKSAVWVDASGTEV